jgi:hypothetical protein
MTRLARRALSALTATALLAGLLVGTPSAVRAADVYYVAHDGVSYSGACASADFSTDDDGYDYDDDAISAAVDTADNGDTIHICAGTYQLDSTIFVDYPVTFVGDGATETILDGGARWTLEDDGITPDELISPGVSILRSDENLSVEAITFTGGWDGECDGSSSGGAICAYQHLTVTDSAFVSNAADEFGGAIGAYTVDISDSSFTGNLSDEGGALITSGGSISNTEFTRNVALSDGGAIFYCSWDQDLLIRNSEFTENLAEDDGSAIFSYGEDQLLSIASSEFRGNVATNGSGTVDVQDAYVVVSNSRFIENSAERGAALFAWGAGLTVTRSTFTLNSTTEDWGGGAINAYSADITSSTFTKNTALEHGGAVVLETAEGVMRRNTFSRNSAVNGGGALSFCSVSRSAARKISGSNRFAGNRGKSSADRNIEAGGWECEE